MAKHDKYIGFEHLYDARIRTEDGFEFPIHRVLLAMRSEYFRHLLCNLSNEDKDIFVSGIEGSTMKVIIQYIYTKELNVNPHRIGDVLIASYYLGMDELVKSSRCFAISNMSIKNTIPLFMTAIRIEDINISKTCSRYIEVNFDEIVNDKSSKFEDLPVEYLEKFLALDSLNVSSERQRWNAINVWVGKLPEERRLYLKRLIQCVRFQHLSDDLVSEMLDHPFVKDHFSPTELSEMLSSSSSTLRRHIPERIFFITKYYVSRSDYSEGIKFFVTYDGEIDFWRNISSKVISPDVVLHSSGPIVMMFETRMNLVHVFDVISKRWSTLDPPSTSRRLYNVLKLGSHVYALGGLSSENETEVIERYNIDSGIWEVVHAPLALSQSSAATIDNRIYLIGTISGVYNQLLAAQVYNPDADDWRTIKSPLIYRTQFALIAYRNQLLVIGGHDNEGILKSVEVYDEDEDAWMCFEDLPFPYVLPKAVTIKEIVYVYETNPEDSYNCPCPPVYWNENSSKWQVVEASSPFQDLHLYQFCTIEDSSVISQMTRDSRDQCVHKWEKSPFFTDLHS